MSTACYTTTVVTVTNTATITQLTTVQIGFIPPRIRPGPGPGPRPGPGPAVTADNCSVTIAPSCAPCFLDAGTSVYSYPTPLTLVSSTIERQPYVYTTNGTLTTSFSTLPAAEASSKPNGTANSTISSSTRDRTYTGDITWTTNNYTL